MSTLGKGTKVLLSLEECDALSQLIGQAVSPTRVKRYSRMTIDGCKYHSASYKRATKANNFTVMYKGGLGIIQNYIHVASGVVAFVQTLQPAPTSLAIDYAAYLDNRIVSVERGTLKAIKVEDIIEKCVSCPVGPAEYISRILLKFLIV